jgi:hypothetical protein
MPFEILFLFAALIITMRMYFAVLFLLLASCSRDKNTLSKPTPIHTEKIFVETHIYLQDGVSENLAREVFNVAREYISYQFNLVLVNKKVEILKNIKRLSSDVIDYRTISSEMKNNTNVLQIAFVTSDLTTETGIRAVGLFLPSENQIIFNTSGYDLRAINTLVHELGHYLGANHSFGGVMFWRVRHDDHTTMKFYDRRTIGQITKKLRKAVRASLKQIDNKQ